MHRETVLTVAGMSCKSCIARVDKALRQLDGVQSVEVELRSGLVRVRHAPELTATQLAARVTAAGYPSRAATA